MPLMPLSHTQHAANPNPNRLRGSGVVDGDGEGGGAALGQEQTAHHLAASTGGAGHYARMLRGGRLIMVNNGQKW